MATPGQGSRRPRPHPAGARDSAGPPREARQAEREADDDAETPSRPPRNFMLALILALIVFLILISVRVFWDGMGTRRTPPVPLSQEQTAPTAPVPSSN